jgi:hypothetical protein
LQKKIDKAIKFITFKKIKIYFNFKKKLYLKIISENKNKFNEKLASNFKLDTYEEGSILAAAKYSDFQQQYKIFKKLKKNLVKK